MDYFLDDFIELLRVGFIAERLSEDHYGTQEQIEMFDLFCDMAKEFLGEINFPDYVGSKHDNVEICADLIKRCIQAWRQV